MARWLVKILKTLINTGESGIVYCMECWKYVGLTLTWDVLKLEDITDTYNALEINFNMGCIETFQHLLSVFPKLWINFNMGCIETTAIRKCSSCHSRLTLTWDVLKLYNAKHSAHYSF